MFLLRVHSVDTPHSLSPTQQQQQEQQQEQQQKGVLHLYRNASKSSLPTSNPNSHSSSLLIVAVPNYLSPLDFVFRFSPSLSGPGGGPQLDSPTSSSGCSVLFIMNDAVEDRYSVLIDFADQVDADRFYHHFNGKRFAPAEAEVCHILFVNSVDFTESAEVASMPPVGFTALPTCPICLERLDPDTSGILSTLCDHSFQCSCTSKWTYLSCQVCRLCQQDEKPACSICGTLENLWVCLICGFVGCARYKEGHAIRHWQETKHCYSLDLTTQQIWDYVGDNYVHRLNQSKADGKLVEMNSHCVSGDGGCGTGTCGCSEDSGMSEVLFHSKVETIVDEYNRLLATQLENQRQYYESLIIDAKSKREISILEAVEKAVASSMQDMQNQLEKFEHETLAVADINRNLIKDQEIWRKKAKEIEERESSSLQSKDEMIRDIEEQIRDLTVYIEAQKTIESMTGADDIREGILLPVPNQTSNTNKKRHTRSSRRRN